MSEWVSMDSAPRDGTRILAWIPTYGVVHMIYFDTASNLFRIAFDEHLLRDEVPTNWMPLPEPPTETATEEE